MIGKATDFKLQLVTKEFTLAMREMHRRLRNSVTYQQVVDHEVGRVMESAANKTGSANRQKIRESVARKSMFTVRGKKWGTKNFRSGREWRLPNDVWAGIEVRRNAMLTRKLAAVGITKRSWVNLAEKMGQPISVAGFVQAASVEADTSGNTETRGTASTTAFIRMIKNSHPLLDVPATQGIRAFFAAVAGRVNYFHTNVKKAVFTDLADAAAKYKGMNIRF
jgi:hypothetical protein